MKTIQMPEDNLVMASGAPAKRDGELFLCTKKHTSITVNGEAINVADVVDGVCGFMLLFDDYEKALKWVDYDSLCVHRVTIS
jgi:hypothetical protein